MTYAKMRVLLLFAVANCAAYFSCRYNDSINDAEYFVMNCSDPIVPVRYLPMKCTTDSQYYFEHYFDKCSDYNNPNITYFLYCRHSFFLAGSICYLFQLIPNTMKYGWGLVNLYFDSFSYFDLITNSYTTKPISLYNSSIYNKDLQPRDWMNLKFIDGAFNMTNGNYDAAYAFTYGGLFPNCNITMFSAFALSPS